LGKSHVTTTPNPRLYLTMGIIADAVAKVKHFLCPFRRVYDII